MIGEKGNIGQANYAAAKSGLFGLTNSLALETARKGITVNSVAPGFIATEMVAAIPEDILNRVIATIPVGRLGEPDEVARVVVFLADPDSGYITRRSSTSTADCTCEANNRASLGGVTWVGDAADRWRAAKRGVGAVHVVPVNPAGAKPDHGRRLSDTASDRPTPPAGWVAPLPHLTDEPIAE